MIVVCKRKRPNKLLFCHWDWTFPMFRSISEGAVWSSTYLHIPPCSAALRPQVAGGGQRLMAAARWL